MPPSFFPRQHPPIPPSLGAQAADVMRTTFVQAVPFSPVWTQSYTLWRPGDWITIVRHLSCRSSNHVLGAVGEPPAQCGEAGGGCQKLPAWANLFHQIATAGACGLWLERKSSRLGEYKCSQHPTSIWTPHMGRAEDFNTAGTEFLSAHLRFVPKRDIGTPEKVKKKQKKLE